MKKSTEIIKLIFSIIGAFITTFIIGLMSSGTIAFCFFLNIEKYSLENYNIYQETYEQAKLQLISPINIIATILSISILIITTIKIIILLSKKEVEQKKVFAKFCIGLSIIWGILLGFNSVYLSWWDNTFMCPCGAHPKYTIGLEDTM